MSTLAINAVFDKAIEQLDRERRRLLSNEAASTASGQPKFDHDGFYAVSRPYPTLSWAEYWKN